MFAPRHHQLRFTTHGPKLAATATLVATFVASTISAILTAATTNSAITTLVATNLIPSCSTSCSTLSGAERSIHLDQVSSRRRGSLCVVQLLSHLRVVRAMPRGSTITCSAAPPTEERPSWQLSYSVNLLLVVTT